MSDQNLAMAKQDCYMYMYVQTNSLNIHVFELLFPTLIHVYTYLYNLGFEKSSIIIYVYTCIVIIMTAH